MRLQDPLRAGFAFVCLCFRGGAHRHSPHPMRTRCTTTHAPDRLADWPGTSATCRQTWLIKKTSLLGSSTSPIPAPPPIAPPPPNPALPPAPSPTSAPHRPHPPRTCPFSASCSVHTSLMKPLRATSRTGNDSLPRDLSPSCRKRQEGAGGRVQQGKSAQGVSVQPCAMYM